MSYAIRGPVRNPADMAAAIDAVPGLNESGMAWLATRPPAVQALIREFPPGTLIQYADGSPFGFVASYLESADGLMVGISPHNPHEDYKASQAEKDFVCAEHLRDGQWGQLGKPFEPCATESPQTREGSNPEPSGTTGKTDSRP